MPTNHLAFCDCLLTFCPTTDGSWWGIFRLDLAKPAWMILANFGEEVGWDKSQPVCSALPPLAPPSIGRPWAWPGQNLLGRVVIHGQGCCGKETIIEGKGQLLDYKCHYPVVCPIPSQNICRSALTRGRVTVYIDGFSIDDWSISFPFLSMTLTCIIFFLSSVIISSIIFIIIIITRP